MVFKQNKESCKDNSYQCLLENIRKEDSMNHMAFPDVFIGGCAFPNSLGGELENKHACESSPVVDWHHEKLVTVENDYRIHGDMMSPGDHQVGDSAGLFNVSRATTGRNGDSFHPEPSKRPLNFDESCEHTWKRPKQTNDHSDTFIPEVSNPVYIPEIPHNSVDELLNDTSKGVDEVYRNCGDLIENHSHGMFADMQCENDEIVSESSPREIFHAECGEKSHPLNQQVFSENVKSFFWDYYAPKRVALGPDHQANIPACRSQCPVGHDENIDKFKGTCVIPMPDANSEVFIDVKNRQGGPSCACIDRGSVSCVKQHVNKARAELLEALGSHKFAELGFCDMGEGVALKWTEEEENLFHQVVFMHRASQGKNFWKVLPQVFPDRSSKDFVSYYFNVFMLRKRAAQNRCDPLHVDSDHDEWQESDDYDQYDQDDEEDSGLESPTNLGVCERDNHEEEDGEAKIFHVQNEDNGSDDYAGKQGDARASERSQSVEHDCQDDSCMSYEVQHGGGDSRCLNEISVVGTDISEMTKNMKGECKDSLVHLSDPDYGGVSEQKPWESYFSMSEKVDFLPTCNVIEEVLGKGTWDISAADDRGAV